MKIHPLFFEVIKGIGGISGPGIFKSPPGWYDWYKADCPVVEEEGPFEEHHHHGEELATAYKRIRELENAYNTVRNDALEEAAVFVKTEGFRMGTSDIADELRKLKR